MQLFSLLTSEFALCGGRDEGWQRLQTDQEAPGGVELSESRKSGRFILTL